MICEMMNPLQSPVREYSLFTPEGRTPFVSRSAGFDQGTAAVSIIVRITVLVRSG